MEDTAPTVASLHDLYSRPGFLLRRGHQIAVAIFLEETHELDVTSTQYGALYIIQRVPRLDQIGLARLLGIDRSTSALVLTKLEASGWITRQTDAVDRRRKVLVLTPEGAQVLEQLTAPAQRIRDRLLEAFTPDEQTQFLGLMSRFVDAFNGQIRTPIMPPEGA
ncbi:MAG TPA: MarR family transcriptional regulator [Caulobacteraceae bacterium]